MKLLVYSHSFAPNIGGVETIVLSLARGLAELRSEDGSPEFELTLVTRTTRGDFNDSALPFRVIRQPGLWHLWKLVREAEAVHIAGPSFSPMLLAWLARKPYFLEHHTYQAICPNGLLIHQPDRAICPGHFQLKNYGECRKCELVENSGLRAVLKILAAFPRRALVGRARANLAVSEHVKRRIAAPRSVVIYHGVEGQKRTNAPQTEAGRVCFGFVGRFVPEKGIPVFLDALAKLKDEGYEFSAKLIGDGPERAKLEKQIATLDLNADVKITGYLSGEALAAEVADVSVIVMPSVWEETAGLAAMEQMRRGRLVVCSNVGGLAEIVGDAGLHFRMGDAVELAEKLRQILINPQLVQTMGSKARALTEAKFLQATMIEGHAEEYRKRQQRTNESAERLSEIRGLPKLQANGCARLTTDQAMDGNEPSARPQNDMTEETMTDAPTEQVLANTMSVRALEGTHELVVKKALQYLPQKGTALDLGAWSGALTQQLQRAGFQVTAADVENKFGLQTEFVTLDCNDPDFDAALAKKFDLVVAVEVIEHLENPTGFLRSISRLLKPGGFAILTTPNVDNAAARLKFFRSGTIRTMEENTPEHITPIHLDLFLRKSVLSAGMKLVEHCSYPEGQFPLTGRKYLVLFFRLAALLMRGPALTGDTHVFVLSNSAKGGD